ncbi:hypothetical protein NDU88_002809 [Pleurodeles waltl]|uniref:Secreted protein n=1 Tax=Pleurodeles waltl TaxID=8319 RepID=A0AAV7MWS6_PLEWA|nr:hypothetical protein NDU88_002809 [Pleurodeles waltl]
MDKLMSLLISIKLLLGWPNGDCITALLWSSAVCGPNCSIRAATGAELLPICPSLTAELQGHCILPRCGGAEAAAANAEKVRSFGSLRWRQPCDYTEDKRPAVITHNPESNFNYRLLLD